MTEYPVEYRQSAAPPTFVFEALVLGGEVIEVRKCLSKVALAPGEVYQSKVQDRDFFLFWAEDIGIAAQRATHLAKRCT